MILLAKSNVLENYQNAHIIALALEGVQMVVTTASIPFVLAQIPLRTMILSIVKII